MKKLLLIFCALIATLSASAQMEVIDNSFRDYAAGNKDAGGENGIGFRDVTPELVIWPYDQDGNEGTLALLVAYFENLSPDDVKKIGVSTSSNSYVNSKEYVSLDGRPALKIFLLAGNNIDVTFSNQLGSTRLQGKNFAPKHVYEVGIRNKSLQNVAITSTPAGATVRWDGMLMDEKTPMTIKNVRMGHHTLALSPANSEIADPVNEHTIDVTASNAAFHFPMHKTKTLNIQASPADSYLELLLDGQVVKSGTGFIRVPDAEYGTMYLLKGRKGLEYIEQEILVGPNTPETIIQKVVGMRSISITAKQNNKEVAGAEIMINGKVEGETPLTQSLEIGQKYEIQASYGGYSKAVKYKVKDGSQNLLIRIPNKKATGFNPFDVDYRRRAWGIAVNYISRYYNMKVNGKTVKRNWLGDDGASDGIQVGIVYQPYFGAGQGLSTGLFYQRTFGSTTIVDESGYYSKTEEYDYYENALYVPFQYQFRLPLHRNTSIALNAGVALTYGLGNKFTLGDGDSKQTLDVGYGYNEKYSTYCPEKLDYSLLLGAAFQWKALQFEVKYSLGLKDHSKNIQNINGTTDKFSYKSSFVSAGLSLLF